MSQQRFSARVTPGPRSRGVIAVPFDPDAAWGAKAEHPVGGTIDGQCVRGTLTPDEGGWAFTVSPMWMRDAGVEAGMDATSNCRRKARSARIWPRTSPPRWRPARPRGVL